MLYILHSTSHVTQVSRKTAIFRFDQKTAVDRFIRPNLVYLRSFIKRCCKFVEMWDSKLVKFYKEMYRWEQPP